MRLWVPGLLGVVIIGAILYVCKRLWCIIALQTNVSSTLCFLMTVAGSIG